VTPSIRSAFTSAIYEFATHRQDLLEYALLVGLIALVAAVAVTAAGQSINNIFGAVAGALAGIPI
jgi:Flp pilus assembly pilin Flp